MPKALPTMKVADEDHQAQGQPQVAVADGDGQAGGVAAHERDEVAAGHEADGVGHAGEHRQLATSDRPMRPRHFWVCRWPGLARVT